MGNYRTELFSTRIATAVLFVVLAVSGIGFSLYLFYIANSLYMFVVASIFTILALISGLFNVFAATCYYRSFFYAKHFEDVKRGLKPLKSYPSVALIMVSCNEDPRIIKRCLLRLLELNYDKARVRYYLGDDSTDREISSSLREFCRQHGVAYTHRNGREGFKAGNINNVLRHSKEELVAIFDYDEYITDRNFLVELVPYFSDRKLAYVQTEKKYASGKGLFAESVALFDAFFFKFVQQARAFNNTAIFAGSCGIIRRSVIEGIGGFPEYITEDTFFSFESDMKGYKSLYVPKVYALGKPLESFTKLVKQQWRYNYGGTQFLWYFYRHRKPNKISPLSHIDYLTHGFGLNFASVILLFFTLVSVLIVLFVVPVVNLTFQQIFNIRYIEATLEIFGAIAFVLSLMVPVILTKVYFRSIRKGIMMLFLNFALAVVRTKAAIAATFNMNPTSVWGAKTSSRKRGMLFALMNTRIELLITLGLVVFGTWAALNNNIAGSIWLLWYAALYSLATIFFYKYG